MVDQMLQNSVKQFYAFNSIQQIIYIFNERNIFDSTNYLYIQRKDCFDSTNYSYIQRKNCFHSKNYLHIQPIIYGFNGELIFFYTFNHGTIT